MTQNSLDNNNNHLNGLMKIYVQAVKNVPILKYSWVLIATICILSLAAYFKLENSDVFFYALLVIVISFLGFLFSYLLKTKDKFIRFLLYSLLTSLVITSGTAVLGLGTFIIWEKPKFYNRWFPNQSQSPKSDTITNKADDTTHTNKDIYVKVDTAEKKKTHNTEMAKKELPIPPIKNPGIWKPAANIIKKNKQIKLSQFELYGIESAYLKDEEPFAANGTKTYPTYSLDPYFGNSGSSSSTLAPIPIFNVVIENTSNKEILLTKILYRVSKVGQVMGGGTGMLEPNARYEHVLEWKTGDQEFALVPPFKIEPQSFGSFMLQLKTNKKDIGLCWLMKVYFFTSNDEGAVSTDVFQLVMTGPYNN